MLYLRSGPATAVGGPAVVLIEPLRSAGEHKGQGVAARIPHVGVQVANVAFPIHVVVASGTKGRVCDEHLGHAARVYNSAL